MRSTLAVHTLLRLRDTRRVQCEQPAQGWVLARLSGAPWVVVRRSRPLRDWCAAGLRGVHRSQRCAIQVPRDAIEQVTTPQDLITHDLWRTHPRRCEIPAIRALPKISSIMHHHVPCLGWGPTGSVGLELASGEAWATACSDLDLMLRATQPIAQCAAAALYRDLASQAVQVDLLIETPAGAVALADWATHDAPWLLRTQDGPKLVTDPWACESKTAAS